MRFSTSAVVSSTILSSVYAATWQVTVGANNALTFIPSVVKANVGDMVQFNFVSQVWAKVLIPGTKLTV
jgi:plastocyanin